MMQLARDGVFSRGEGLVNRCLDEALVRQWIKELKLVHLSGFVGQIHADVLSC